MMAYSSPFNRLRAICTIACPAHENHACELCMSIIHVSNLQSANLHSTLSTSASPIHLASSIHVPALLISLCQDLIQMCRQLEQWHPIVCHGKSHGRQRRVFFTHTFGIVCAWLARTSLKALVPASTQQHQAIGKLLVPSNAVQLVVNKGHHSVSIGLRPGRRQRWHGIGALGGEERAPSNAPVPDGVGKARRVRGGCMHVVAGAGRL